MITREQVADLRVGDVVDLSWPSPNDPDVTVTMRGTLRGTEGRALCLGITGIFIRRVNGEPVYGDVRSLEVISRAPRPLYVNSDKTEPDPGDVVRDADDPTSEASWNNCGIGVHEWFTPRGHTRHRDELPARLRLLVDGSTGQVVPS